MDITRTVLCGDIGATNTRLSIVVFRKNKPQIMLIKLEKTKNISSFTDLVHHAIAQSKKEHKLTPEFACFGVAGPIINGKSKLTNVKLTIDSKDIEKKTKLKTLLINDFSAVGYGINVLGIRDMKTLQIGKSVKGATKIAIGAGTGLGKSILYYDGFYKPLPSEGGHADFPLLDPHEYPLAEYIMKKRKINYLCYDDMLSGRGLEDIYGYLQYTFYPRQPKNLPPETISRTKKKNLCAKEAFKLFVKFYARSCKNFALDTFSTGGIYLAGGITAKNPEVFGRDFIKEFTKNDEYKALLKKIPIKIIKNQHVGLLGAAFAAIKHFKVK